MNWPSSSSPYGDCQPPRSNPNRRSSSGPPPPWYTPSKLTKTIAVNFMALRLTLSASTGRGGAVARIESFDHVGITVADLDSATAFFVALGLVVEGRTYLEG